MFENAKSFNQDINRKILEQGNFYEDGIDINIEKIAFSLTQNIKKYKGDQEKGWYHGNGLLEYQNN